MTRTATFLCTFAVIVAGGSFALGPSFGSVAHAADTPPAAPPADTGAQLNITPLRIELDQADRGETVLLSNSSSRPLAVQTRLFAWTQTGGEDVYAPSTDLTISPSITTIPPGETQIVRVLRKGASSPGEKRFRLIVDQLPDPALVQAGQAEARIRFSLPVFVDRDTVAPAGLAWRIGRSGIELANTGGQTARVVRVDIKRPDGSAVPVERNTLRYVQGSSAIVWPMGNACSLGPVTVTASVDGQMVDAQPASTCG